MNPLAYFAIELNRQNQREAERERRVQRERYGDEPAAARDRFWAAAMHRFAVRSNEAKAAERRTESRPAVEQSASEQSAFGYPAT